jgi:hypothetical protein
VNILQDFQTKPASYFRNVFTKLVIGGFTGKIAKFCEIWNENEQKMKTIFPNLEELRDFLLMNKTSASGRLKFSKFSKIVTAVKSMKQIQIVTLLQPVELEEFSKKWPVFQTTARQQHHDCHCLLIQLRVIGDTRHETIDTWIENIHFIISFFEE